MSTTPRYFTNLDGLRFFGCLLVLWAHYEMIKKSMGLPDCFWIFTRLGVGQASVTAFFVISGFLITHLLLSEKQNTGTIGVWKFYQRRILRLWPLYFVYLLILFITVQVITPVHAPGALRQTCVQPTEQPWVFYFTHLTNLTFLYEKNTAFTHLWTVSVEEQLYLVWPVLLLFVRNVKRSIYVLLVVLLSAKIIFTLLPVLYHFSEQHCVYGPIKRVLVATRYECILTGGLAAVFMHEKGRILNFLQKTGVQWMSIFLMIAVFFVPRTYQFYSQFVIGIFCSVMVLNMAVNEKSVIRIKNRFVINTGKMSYGIYVWHVAVISVVLFAVKKYGPAQWGALSEITAAVLVLAAVYAVSWLSYQLLEQPFLRLKKY